MSKNYNNYSKYSNKHEKTEEPVIETALNETVTVPETPEVIEPEVPEETEEILEGIVSGCKKLNIRTEPKIKADIVCVVDAGEVLEIVDGEMLNGWYQVITETGYEGYCMAQYVTIK